MEDNNKIREDQPKNLLHGVKLVDMLEYLHAVYGWKELGHRIQIRCFQSNPTMKSSLNFLRKTQWARDEVEKLYLDTYKNMF